MENSSASKLRTPRRSREEIERLIRGYRSSGLTRQAFVQQQGIGYSYLYELVAQTAPKGGGSEFRWLDRDSFPRESERGSLLPGMAWRSEASIEPWVQSPRGWPIDQSDVLLMFSLASRLPSLFQTDRNQIR
jgi:hypothetical protein